VEKPDNRVVGVGVNPGDDGTAYDDIGIDGEGYIDDGGNGIQKIGEKEHYLMTLHCLGTLKFIQKMACYVKGGC
jgi:hypothetical protein